VKTSERDACVRVKKDGKTAEKSGRAFSNDRETESFILFAGAVIDLQNTRGEVFYSEIFIGEKQGVAGFVYHKVPKSLFELLVESNFPPQLLAVAVSDLVPLDKITRGGAGSSDATNLKAKAMQIVNAGLDSSMTKEQKDAFNRRLEKMREKSQDNAAGRREEKSYSGDDWDKTGALEINYALATDLLNGWLEPEDNKVISKLKEQSKPRIKGTPVHQIDFRGGMKISRRMACYWRKSRADEYFACVAFLAKLLTAPAPTSPSYKKATVLDRFRTAIFNAKLSNQKWSASNRARLAEKNKDKPRTEMPPKYKDRFGDIQN
jgi:hypothetical protein